MEPVGLKVPLPLSREGQPTAFRTPGKAAGGESPAGRGHRCGQVVAVSHETCPLLAVNTQKGTQGSVTRSTSCWQSEPKEAMGSAG